MERTIEVKQLEKSFGEKKALTDISFNVDEAEIVGFLGPNGAGKSTTIQILTGQIGRDSGEVKVLNLDPEKESVNLREKIGILPEREDPPSFLTGNEYLDFVSDIREEEIDKDEWIERLRMEGKMDRLTQDLSKGERQKLLIAQAFFHNPEIVFIDEPMINLDPVIQEEVKTIFKEFDGTVFLCTHNVDLAGEVCDTVYFIEDGEVTEKHENTDELKQKFLDAYDY
ncbi:MAG: ABC transporter ATP-binding protein [Nanohaloarchaea archaeon]|nr:ABC transporter ATP-binding protein [Candidatus Nanohaloarchaea archaeon]